MGMLFAGAWAGEQLLVVSSTETIIGEDLIESQSWTMGVFCCSSQLEWYCLAVRVLYLIRTCQLEMFS